MTSTNGVSSSQCIWTRLESGPLLHVATRSKDDEANENDGSSESDQSFGDAHESFAFTSDDDITYFISSQKKRATL